MLKSTTSPFLAGTGTVSAREKSFVGRWGVHGLPSGKFMMCLRGPSLCDPSKNRIFHFHGRYHQGVPVHRCIAHLCVCKKPSPGASGKGVPSEEA